MRERIIHKYMRHLQRQLISIGKSISLSSWISRFATHIRRKSLFIPSFCLNTKFVYVLFATISLHPIPSTQIKTKYMYNVHIFISKGQMKLLRMCVQKQVYFTADNGEKKTKWEPNDWLMVYFCVFFILVYSRVYFSHCRIPNSNEWKRVL